PYPSPSGDNDGPGSVKRRGIAALDPLTGVPLSWNPGRFPRGVGAEALHSNDDYLFVGSDTELFNWQLRERLAVILAAGGTPNPLPDDIELPTQLHVAVPGGDLVRADYDGVAFGTPSTVSGPGIDGIDWADVRDGFVQRDQLVYYGAADAYYQRSFDGATFGTPTNLSETVGYVDEDRDLTPYDQPYGVAATHAAAYAHGRVYYTATDDTSRLFWRWYSLESGILGSQEHISSGGDWSGAVALDVMGDWLYAAWDDGNLYRMYIRDGGVVDYSTRQLADDGSSGIDWATITSMFSTQDSGSATPLPPAAEVVCTDPALPWRAEYFPVTTLGTMPVTVQCEAEINYDWGTGSPAGTGVGPNNFSVRWTRDIDLAETETIYFSVVASDGMRIFVDGASVMNEWRDQSPTAFVAAAPDLASGVHEIVVEYYEYLNDAVAQVRLPANLAPNVSAGSDATVTLPNGVALDGTVTDDGLPPGTLSSTWTKASGPGTVVFGDVSEVDTVAGFSQAGEYVLRLSANDGILTDFDDVKITVNAAPPRDDYFIDDDDSIFESDINWMAAEEITRGCNPPVNDRYCPDSRVTRGQMAAFLVRALGLTERLDDPFVDDDDSIFEADIERLAAAGITRGCNPPDNDRFCPDSNVTREQMAAFLVRALGYTD
ncbi:MAG: PA14 domain-containing protein, partial [Acidimicrobiia bacterium]